MPYLRQLPSGMYQATVRLPDGTRVSETHRLREVVKHWALDLEADIRRGDWIDPRLGATTVEQVWTRWGSTRRLELASRRRDDSHWRNHVGPRWARVPVGAVLRPDVKGWVEDMRRAGTGAATIEGSLGVLRAAFTLAVDARLIRANPADGVKAPERPAHLDRVLAPYEDELLLSALDRIVPGRVDGRLFVELLLDCGLRWEEAGAVRRERVDRRRQLIHVGPVLERDGTIREHPKTPAGERPVPVPRHLWARLLEATLATPAGGVVITGPGGGMLDYSRWHDRVWTPALQGLPARATVRGHPAREAIAGAGLEDPQPTPHDLRHTYCTRLGEQGVPAHELMRLSGHANLASVQRYLHAGDGRFDRARDAIERARGEA